MPPRIGLAETDELLLRFPEQLLGSSPDHEIERALYCHYASLRFNRFKENHDENELKEAIEKQEVATIATPKGDEQRPARYDLLGVMFHFRYNVTRNPEDLSNAITNAEIALNSVMNGDEARFSIADRLNSYLTDRYLQKQCVADLDEAVTRTHTMLRDVPQGHKSRGPILFRLSRTLELRYEHKGTMRDLGYAIHCILDGIPSVRNNAEYVQEMLQKLHSLLDLLIQRVGRKQWLENAINYLGRQTSAPMELDIDLQSMLHDLSIDVQNGSVEPTTEWTSVGVADIPSSLASNLCELCESISFKSFYSFGESLSEQTLPSGTQANFLFYKHQPSMEALRESAANGCHFCAQLDYALNKFDFSHGYLPTTFEGIWFSFNPSKSRSDGMPGFFEILYGNQCANAMISTPHTGEEKIWYTTPDREADGDTGSDLNFRLARAWYIRCQGTHLPCAASTSTELPKRIIDVGNQGDTMIRLVDGGPSAEPYAALSHCWGQWGELNALKLLEENIGTLKEGFNLSEMPLAWQQAVLATRELGLNYLWIDSLCIKQRNRVDWEAESKKMGWYYSRASITIAAFDAPNGSYPIFNRRDPVTVKPCKLKFRVPRKGKTLTGYVHASSFEPGISGAQRYNMAPLEQRAWCFQEMVLSPRVLKFGQSQISFACHEYEASELRPEPLSRMDRYGMMQRLLRQTAFRGNAFKSCEHAPGEKCDAHASATNTFYHLVQDYSLLKLTRESDRLAALSGIAQQVHERIGGRYVAGIFSTGLVEGLLWRVIDYIPKNPQFPRQLSSISRRRPRVPNAPSWSWASLELHEAEIKFLYQSAKSTPQISVMAESIQMEAEEKQLNPYGQVLGGRLTMKGTMLAARAQYYNLGSEDYYYGLNLLDDESGEVIGRADFDCKTWPAEKFWCVPIMTVPDLGHIFGLILAPRYEGTYVRIGRFNTERADLLNSLKSEAIIII